ncbi:GMC oxidoreductase [Streptomyces sp. NPDC102406]|uniref:GMC oxidoreductase n=1 Tax=Streptomyces sp. NPDC102406 TaxID=3366171 RepID=UPI003808EBBE
MPRSASTAERITPEAGAGFPDEVDVAIVGSGPAGAAYARTLSELAPHLRLAVFEAGPLISDPPGTHVKNIVDSGERARAQRASEGPRPLVEAVSTDTMDGYASDRPRLQRPGTFLLSEGRQGSGEDGLPAAAMSSNVGGMGAHWTGACPRPGDSEVIAFLPELSTWLAEAERLLHVSAEVLADAPFADEVRKRLSVALDHDRVGDRQVQPMPMAVHRTPDGRLLWCGADTVFGDVTRANPRFSLHAEALVTQVLLTEGGPNGRAVRGLRIRDRRTDTDHEVAARYVVVAGDSLRTPQLLYASGVRPAALGRYLNDQPQVVYAVRMRDLPDRTLVADDGVGVTASSGVAWVPFTDAHPYHGQVMQLDASPVPLADDDLKPGSVVGLGWFCAKELRAEDRVAFRDDDTDGYGMPAMDLHYRLTEADHAAVDGARTEILRAAAALGEPLDDTPPLLFPAGASLHYQGTVRMGTADDGTSVCDPNSQVWGVSGLFVAGNGVIPTATACNPTLTSVALAVAGARGIAAAES